ncbi:MAG: hypothetical protein K2G38_04340, partial [Clostridia bacterium]|nr:hypothetical protein [Clostridia bacterium]
MKKLLISMIAVVSAIIMCFALAGCSKSVKGNTYVFDDFVVEGTIPDELKEEIDGMVADMKENLVGVTYKFNDDGTGVCTWGEGEDDSDPFFYKQDGKKVYLAETKEALDDVDNEDNYVEIFEVDGNKLVQSGTENG